MTDVFEKLKQVEQALVINADPRNSTNQCIAVAREALTLLPSIMEEVKPVDEQVMRKGFEAFVLRGTMPGENFLERDNNGDYVLGVARGGWAAWQAATLLRTPPSEGTKP